MKNKLFSNELSPVTIKDALEAEAVDIQDNFSFVLPFNKLEETEEEHTMSKAMVNKKRLKEKIDALIAPLKDEMKEIEGVIKEAVKNLSQGGVQRHGRVYLFPDYEDNLMGIYDESGTLVATRPLNRAEKQLHINYNSPLNQQSND